MSEPPDEDDLDPADEAEIDDTELDSVAAHVDIAKVVALEASADASPLVFFRGAYGTFAPQAA